MKQDQRSTKALCVTLALLLVAVPLMAQTPSDGGFAQGKVEGERDGAGSLIWGLGGLLLGPIGIVIAYLVPPSVPGAAMVGKSSEFTQGYTESYSSKAKTQNLLWASAGCLVSTVAWTLCLLW